MKELPPIWVINLKRSPDRLQFMEKQLTELEKNFQVIEAVDGKLLNRRDLESYSQMSSIRRYGRELSLAEIGCAFSHIKAWKKLVDENIEEVLIFEDDAKFDESLFAVIRHRDKFPTDYEHINFSTYAAKLPFGEYITGKYKASHYEGQAKLASAYLLTFSGASKLLDDVVPICMPIDIWILKKSDLHSYGVYPNLVELADVKSTIVPSGSYDVPKRGKLFYKLHKFKKILYQVGIHLGFSSQELDGKIIQAKHAWNNVLDLFSN